MRGCLFPFAYTGTMFFYSVLMYRTFQGDWGRFFATSVRTFACPP